MKTCAVILNHNRQDLLAETVARIAPQVGWVTVIDNASDPPTSDDEFPPNVSIFREEAQPPNIAQMWADALDRLEGDGYVAFLCDDSFVPEGWFQSVVDAIDRTGAAAGSTHAITPVGGDMVKWGPDGDVYGRMCGWAFVIRTDAGIRPDPSMHWWWCDTDIDWQARSLGGMVIAPGPVVTNILPNDYTNAKPELGARAGLDRAAFAAKHGSCPW